MLESVRQRCWRWVFGASSVLGASLLAGRLSGLWREVELARAFGLSAQADIAVLLLTLPDLMVNLLLSGGLGAALVPRLRALDAERAAMLVRRAYGVCFAIFGAIALGFALWPTGVLKLLAPGLQPPQVPPIAFFAVALALPLSGLAGVTTAWLNSQHRYLVAGCGTLIFNVCVLAGLWTAGMTMAPLPSLCVGIAAGAALRLASQLASMPRIAWHRGAERVWQDSGLLKNFLAATMSASFVVLAPVIVRALASLLGDGAVAAFNYALKLVELPSAILLGAIATVALTTFSEREAVSDTAGARDAARSYIQNGVLMAVAATAIGAGFALPAVRLALAHGAMGTQALETVANLLRIALMGLPAVAVSGIATAALNAAGQTGAVLRCTALGLLLLPLLALPGVLASSGLLLMAAVAAFQFLLAVLLVRSAGLPTFGPGGWLTRRMCGCVALSVGIAGGAVGVDAVLGLSSDALRVLIAGAGFAGAALASLQLARVGGRARPR
jgi:putative peptidoglycan lipid II flippase